MLPWRELATDTLRVQKGHDLIFVPWNHNFYILSNTQDLHVHLRNTGPIPKHAALHTATHSSPLNSTHSAKSQQFPRQHESMKGVSSHVVKHIRSYYRMTTRVLRRVGGGGCTHSADTAKVTLSQYVTSHRAGVGVCVRTKCWDVQ